MSTLPPETRELLERARRGEEAAFDRLFARYREPLRRAVALRLDRRVAARVDASDVVQETYVEAARRLPAYLEANEMPFDLWLRWLAREKVLAAHRQHLAADKRAVGRELGPLVDSSAQIVRGLVGAGPTPSQALARIELAQCLKKALEELDEEERELIMWRHFEQLTSRETARLLGITDAAASKRYVRALERLRGLLENLGVSRAE